MQKVLAIGTSNSSESINLATIKKMKNVEILNLQTLDVPMYSMQLEKEQGIPDTIEQFLKQLEPFEILLFAVPEYNGNIPPFFKNILDWCSRKEFKFLNNKKIIILTVTPGSRGGASVRNILTTSLPYFGAEVIGSFGVSNYHPQMNFTKELIEIQMQVDQYVHA